MICTTTFLLIFTSSYISILQAASSFSSPPRYTTLETAAGKLRGFRETVLSKELDIFLGIPFAEPPIGDKRFSRPNLKKPWSGVWNATEQPNTCYQTVDTKFGNFEGSQMWNPNTEMSEDCLYMNVWVPVEHSSSSRLKPVMVWIFGGSFAAGTATLDLYDGRIMAAKGDVIIVSIQYRMGVLGFLYLGDELAPGNVGLLDQAVALQWIYTYIEAFGGDKNRITLFGESAGAASVALHLTSPISQKYVNNIILQSASSLAQWAVDSPEVAKSRSLTLAHSLNCKSTFNRAIIKCLKDINVQKLVDKMWYLDDHVSYISTPFVPTVDNYFLLDIPRDILANDRAKLTNVLLGFNKNEGSYFLIYEDYLDKDNSKHISRKLFKDAIRRMLRIDNEDLVNLIAYEYETREDYNPEFTYTHALDNLLGDLAFVCSVIEFADLFTSASNKQVFMYYFNHRTSANPWPEWSGVMHGYEIDHIFGAPINSSLQYSSEETHLSERMLKYWTNFAKSG